MSVTRIKLVRSPAVSAGGLAQVPASIPDASEAITASGTSQATTIAGTPGQVWEISTLTAAVEVVFGADPTAAPGAGSRLLAAGETYYFGVTSAGEKCAVILAA